jgi:hypothetical protein
MLQQRMVIVPYIRCLSRGVQSSTVPWENLVTVPLARNWADARESATSR